VEALGDAAVLGAGRRIVAGWLWATIMASLETSRGWTRLLSRMPVETIQIFVTCFFVSSTNAENMLAKADKLQ